jgi:hypothetical protein
VAGEINKRSATTTTTERDKHQELGFGNDTFWRGVVAEEEEEEDLVLRPRDAFTATATATQREQ